MHALQHFEVPYTKNLIDGYIWSAYFFQFQVMDRFSFFFFFFFLKGSILIAQGEKDLMYTYPMIVLAIASEPTAHKITQAAIS